MTQALYAAIPAQKMSMSHKGMAEFNKTSDLAINGTKGLKSLISNYTGNGYNKLNNALRFEKPGTEAYDMAFATPSKIAEASVPVPENMVLSRATSHGSFQGWKDLEGTMITEPAVLSTSLRGAIKDDSVVMGGSTWIEFKAAPGLKGLSRHGNSAVGNSEQEVIFPPDTKWHIARVYKGGSKDDPGTSTLFEKRPPNVTIVEVILHNPDSMPVGKASTKWDNL